MAIETFILQLIIIGLTWYEFSHPENLYAEGDEEYSPLKPMKGNAVMNMGDDIDETHLLRVENS